MALRWRPSRTRATTSKIRRLHPSRLAEPVSGARITATRVDDRSVTEASTDATGAFRISAIAAGAYALTVRQLGFRPAEIANVRVAAGDTVRVRVTLTAAPRQRSTVVADRSMADYAASHSPCNTTGLWTASVKPLA